MKHILARAQREILAQFSWSKLLVAFDFDGTLAPIVPEPDRARISALTSRLLSSVATAYPTAVISGRSRDDVAARVGGVPLVAVVGNHGAEESDQRPPVTQCVRAWVEVLSERVSAVPGVVLEDKTFSVAVHYRRSRSRKAAREVIESAVGELGGEARMIGGKCVVNIVHIDAPHKGFALQRLRAKVGADRAIYVGDDVTDEDVFALDDPAVLGVRIGRTERSAAPFYLQQQSEIDELLERLSSLRVDRPQAQRADYL